MWRKHNRPYGSVRGVSPVIATILMVAITVVLAATLYMMLPRGGDVTEQQAGAFSQTVEKVEGTKDFEITFAKLSPKREIEELQFKVWNDSSSDNGALVSFNQHRDGISKNFTINGKQYELKYMDQSGNSYVDSGDYLILSESGAGTLGSGCYYEIAMYYDGNELDSVRWKVV